MKKLFKSLLSFVVLMTIILICIFIFAPILQAAPLKNMTNVTVDVSSYPINNTSAAVFICSISSAVDNRQIYRIVVSASSSEYVQKVTLYDNCNSTTTATARFSVYIPSGTAHCPVVIPFTDANPLNITRGLILRKSLPDSDVQANISYK